MGEEIKGKWEWRVGCTSGQSFSQTLIPLHIKKLQWIQKERSSPWAQGGWKSLPIVGVVPGRKVFSLFLILDALGMIRQMLCEPWFKAGKGRFLWDSIEMTLKSRGSFQRWALLGGERKKTSRKEYLWGRVI